MFPAKVEADQVALNEIYEHRKKRFAVKYFVIHLHEPKLAKTLQP